MSKKFKTREEWLNYVADKLRPYYKSKQAEIPARVRYAVGYTSNGYRGNTIGECWSSKSSADKTTEILIKPTEHKPERVAGILAHELIHAADDCKNGHKKPFKRMAVALGFEGKMTLCLPGAAMMRDVIRPILKTAGPLPHAAVTAYRVTKKQTTRLLKAECTTCGYVVRVSAKWLQLGAPFCGNTAAHGRDKVRMVCDDFEDEGDDE